MRSGTRKRLREGRHSRRLMHQIKWCSNAPVQPPITITNSNQLPAYGALNLSCLPMTGNFLQVSPVHAAAKPLWQDNFSVDAAFSHMQLSFLLFYAPGVQLLHSAYLRLRMAWDQCRSLIFRKKEPRDERHVKCLTSQGFVLGRVNVIPLGRGKILLL